VNSHIPIDNRFRPRPLSNQHVEHQPEPVRTISSEALFQGRTEIAIDHSGSIYRLKVTRQGKLILNK
jgi:hemin uptake protein HemP